jgi:hypothetical protein
MDQRQPSPADKPTSFGSYDSITVAAAENHLVAALEKVRAFRKANPDFTGPVRLHVAVNFNSFNSDD